METKHLSDLVTYYLLEPQLETALITFTGSSTIIVIIIVFFLFIFVRFVVFIVGHFYFFWF